jgi:hypothetical protein
MSEHFSMLHPHFTPDITLGHLMQAVVVVATVGGGVLGGYLSLRSDLETQRAEFLVALAGHEARLLVAERLIEERRTEDRQFEADMRTLWSASCRRSPICAPPSSANKTANNFTAHSATIQITQRTRGLREVRDGTLTRTDLFASFAHPLRPSR